MSKWSSTRVVIADPSRCQLTLVHLIVHAQNEARSSQLGDTWNRLERITWEKEHAKQEIYDEAER